jgi:hypothetical protein
MYIYIYICVNIYTYTQSQTHTCCCTTSRSRSPLILFFIFYFLRPVAVRGAYHRRCQRAHSRCYCREKGRRFPELCVCVCVCVCVSASYERAECFVLFSFFPSCLFSIRSESDACFPFLLTRLEQVPTQLPPLASPCLLRQRVFQTSVFIFILF